MSDIAAPAVVMKTHDGKILAVMPLKAVPAPGCVKWNARIGAKHFRRQA